MTLEFALDYVIIEINIVNYDTSGMEVISMTEIGLKIKGIRSSRKISQRKLAALAGISNTYLSDIEVGRTNPSLKTMEKLAKALEIEIKDLF